MNKANPFADLDALRRESAEAFRLDELRGKPAGGSKPRKRKQSAAWKRHYVRVPWEWVERLRKAKRASSIKLALVLLYVHWRNDGRPIAVSNILAEEAGISRRSKLNALVELQELDLITADRQKRRSPRVTLKCLGRPET